MTWISNLSISVSTAVIFYFITGLLMHILIDGSTGREWYKERYVIYFGIACWILFNIWQWVVLT